VPVPAPAPAGTRLRQDERLTRRLAAVVTDSNDAVILFDPAGHIQAWNRGAQAMYGWNESEALRMNLRDLTPPEGAAGMGDMVRRLLAGETVTSFETRRRTKDGRVLEAWLTVTAVRDEAGKIVAIATTERDTTQRKQAEAQLQELTQRLTYHVDHSPLAVIEWGPDMRLTRWSSTAERIFGWKAREVLGKRMEDFRWVYEEDQTQVAEVSGQLQTGTDARRFSANRNYRKDGSVAYCEWYNSSLVDEAGHLRSILSLVLDVTERQRAEQDLHRLNRALHALGRSSQAMLRADQEKSYLEEVCRIVVEDCGYAMAWIGYAEQDPDRTVRPVAYAGFEDGYLETLQLTWADSERGRGPTGTAIRTGQPAFARNMQTDPLLAPWRAQALKRGYASSLAVPLLAEGQAFGALTIYFREPNPFTEDEVRLLTELAGDLASGITVVRLRTARARAVAALREREEQLRLFIDHAPAAIAMFDTRMRYLAVSQRWLVDYGLTGQTILGRSHYEVFPEVPERWKQTHRRCLAGAVEHGDEDPFDRADGTRQWIKWEALPWTGADGAIGGIVIFSEDVTERMRAAAALRRAAEELQRSNQDLQQFASVAGHDLQEPLRMVSGFLKLLEQEYQPRLDDKARQYIRYALEGATRMAQLITDLLAYSRVTSREKKLEPVDANQPLALALANLRASIEQAGAGVTQEELPTVPGDASQLVQLFQNLVGNALKFRHADRPCQVHISARQQEGKWVFAVRDNGIGIAPPAFARIFEVFERLHSREKYPGTGMGLAICKKIVERHGGKIWVESQPDVGSTFYFTLPPA
jgi:PAS domain S-box-containing protein